MLSRGYFASLRGFVALGKCLPCLLILCAFCPKFVWGADAFIGPEVNYFKVDTIEVRGNRKVEKEAILEKISIRPGMMLDNYLLRRDIDKIYSMKFFEFVEAQGEEQGGKNTLIFIVKERPVISKIILTGNTEVGDDDLKTQIKSKEFSILDINTVKSDVAAIQKYYEEKGYYLAGVEHEIKDVDADKEHLIFKIKEFQKVKVKDIFFHGVRAFDPEQIRAVMETRKESLFSFMTGSGNFKEFNFDTDIERIKYFYKTKGHLQVNVGIPEITVSEDKKWVFISVRVQEGPKFTVNQITYTGELIFPESTIKEKVSLAAGEDYSEEKLRKDIQNLTELYQDEGYAFANVLRTLSIVPGENKVDVEFSFEKGKIAHFGKIIVKGNSKTRDKVIRRELKIREGQKFSGSSLRISKDNVNRLGFFEPGSILFNTVSPKGRDDVLDVEINVKERNTGQVTMGAGYSTNTGFFFQGSVSQNNFRGLGQTLSANFSRSRNSQTYSLGFTEPYLFDTQWTAGGDIYDTRNETSASFSYQKKGFDLRVGHPIFDYTRLFVTYKIEDTKIRNVDDPTIIPAVENALASSVETSLITDKRDNKFEPTRGYYGSLSAEYAGVGGEQEWLKAEADGRYYYNVFGELIMRTRFNIAKLYRTGSPEIPRTKKFVLGGARNMRGYAFEDIGPLLTTTVNGVTRTFNRGGLFSMYGTVELEHPLVKEAGLKWVLFYDAGNVFESHFGENGNRSLRADYGFGVRWFSPIGVLRFEFGYPINKRAREQSSQFHFDIGQLF